MPKEKFPFKPGDIIWVVERDEDDIAWNCGEYVFVAIVNRYVIASPVYSGESDLDGLRIEEAELISGCKEHKGHLYKDGCLLDNGGLVDDDYYCYQENGYCEDDYNGTLYFKTNVPGQFVAVPFETY